MIWMSYVFVFAKSIWTKDYKCQEDDNCIWNDIVTYQVIAVAMLSSIDES
jgi:hypothetical protein